MMRRAFWAVMTIAMFLMALAPAQASPAVVLGFVSGPLPAKVTPNHPVELQITFNTTFAALSNGCLDLELAARGGALTGAETGRLHVVGGGPGTTFRRTAGERRTTNTSVCTNHPADVQVMRHGTYRVVVSMRSGTIAVRGAGASAYR